MSLKRQRRPRPGGLVPIAQLGGTAPGTGPTAARLPILPGSGVPGHALPALTAPHSLGSPWGSPPPSSHKHPAYPSMEGRERGASSPSPCSWATDTPTITTQPDSRREEEGQLVTSRSSAKKNAGEGVSKDTLGWRDTSFHFQGDRTSWILPMLLQVV